MFISTPVLALLLVLVILLGRARKCQPRWSLAFGLILLASLVAFASCGGGSSGPPPPPPNPGTPVGLDQNVVVTFNGAGVSPSPALNLSVNVE